MSRFLPKFSARSTRTNAAGKHRESAEAVPDAPRHSGYAPTDTGSPVLGHLSQHAVGHCGYAPADTGGPGVGKLQAGTPGGMAASGGHAQGSGDVQGGPHHTGWAPEDREYKKQSTDSPDQA